MSGVDAQGVPYYQYNRNRAVFDSDDDEDMLNWEDQILSVDVPLVVDMSHWVGCITRSVLLLVSHQTIPSHTSYVPLTLASLSGLWVKRAMHAHERNIRSMANYTPVSHPYFRNTLPYDMFFDKISDGVILCNFGNTINAMTGFGARRQISNILHADSDTDGSIKI